MALDLGSRLEEQRGLLSQGTYFQEKYKAHKKELDFIEARELFKDALDLAEQLREEKAKQRRVSYSFAKEY